MRKGNGRSAMLGRDIDLAGDRAGVAVDVQLEVADHRVGVEAPAIFERKAQHHQQRQPAQDVGRRRCAQPSQQRRQRPGGQQRRDDVQQPKLDRPAAAKAQPWRVEQQQQRHAQRQRQQQQHGRAPREAQHPQGDPQQRQAGRPAQQQRPVGRHQLGAEQRCTSTRRPSATPSSSRLSPGLRQTACADPGAAPRRSAPRAAGRPGSARPPAAARTMNAAASPDCSVTGVGGALASHRPHAR